MITSTMCGWCHEMIPATQRYCGSCGHAAGSRLACDCPRCRAPLVRLASGADYVDLGRDDDSDLIDLARMED